MKKLSETLKELGIKFTFPVEIVDDNGNVTYYEDSNGWRRKCEFDGNGRQTYYEDSNKFWSKREYDTNGHQTYFEDNNGYKRGTSRRQTGGCGVKSEYVNEFVNIWKRHMCPAFDQSCGGKVIEVDGKKYKLTEL